MKNETGLVRDRAGVEEIVVELRRHDCIGVDTEFIRETTFFPKIALMQVATISNSWLIDPTVLTKEDLEPFLDVLKDPKILKVMHAAYADQECFYWGYDFVATPVLDTAVAAALTGYGDNVGLGKLLKEVLHINLPKGRARAKWLQRPLSRELLTYAEQDVAHLVALSSSLMERLKKRGRVEWALEESDLDPTVFDVPPEDMAKRLAKNGQLEAAAFPVLVELLRWREDRARHANLPRGWVADNDILVALSKVRPTTVDDLRAFRGLNAKELERSGQNILAAIQRGKDSPREAMPPVMRPSAPAGGEDHVFDFIRTYVSYLAAHHAIALRYLVNTNKLLLLAQRPEFTEQDWVTEGILSARSLELIGKDLTELLKGRRGLTLRQGRVEVLEFPQSENLNSDPV